MFDLEGKSVLCKGNTKGTGGNSLQLPGLILTKLAFAGFVEQRTMSNDFQIRVTGILIHQGKILIVKQRLSDKRPWSLPGGRLEHGESLEQAAIRELYEETGITARIERLLYICDVKPMNQVVHITFLMTYVKGDICLPDNSHDENPISDVIFADIECLTDYGFSEKFVTLIKDGFPKQGSYMGDKSNIG